MTYHNKEYVDLLNIAEKIDVLILQREFYIAELQRLLF